MALTKEKLKELFAAGEFDQYLPDPVVTWASITGKPSTFPPSTHNHTKAQITDFPTSMPASDVYAWAKAATKPSYTYTEVGAAASSHTHTKANITDFPTSMPASDVYAWAKAATKPSYTHTEVGAAAASHGNHVPTTQIANDAVYLRNDNTWQTITAAKIGAAAASHSHNYLSNNGSSDYIAQYFNTSPANDFDNITNSLSLSQGANGPFGAFAYLQNFIYSTADQRAQLAISYNANPGRMAFRTLFGGVWRGWYEVLHSGNYNSYAPTKTGTGASGTWGISITGNAATLTDFSVTKQGSPVPLNDAISNGLYYVNNASGIFSGVTDGAGFVQAFSTAWAGQIFQDYRSGQIALRGKNNGTWQAWRRVYDSGNLRHGTAAPSGGVDGDIYIQY